MRRIATPNQAADLFGAGKPGFRAAVAGVSSATEFSAIWFNHVQEAVVRTIEATGASLSDTDYDQFTNSLIGLMALNGSAAGNVIFSIRTSAPPGYLKANGALISRTTYAALFAAIGTTFGAGDGATTFGLPDLRGEFLRGWDDGRGVDAGRGIGTSQEASKVFYHSYGETDFIYRVENTTVKTGAFGTPQQPQYQPASSPHFGEQFTYEHAASYPKDTTTAAWYPVKGAGQAWPGPDAALSGSYRTRPRNIALLACIKY